MDRVLLAIDHRQFSTHLESALRKVGYKVELIQNEYSLSEKILSFNPEIVVVKGSTSKLSTYSVSKKIKDMSKFSGKVILVFEEGQLPATSQFENLKYDLVLEEPASALRIAIHILNFDPSGSNTMLEKLTKMSSEDISFRENEAKYLVQYGLTIDQDVYNIQNNKYKQPELQPVVKSSESRDEKKIFAQIQQELNQPEYNSLQKRKIEQYNQAIEKIDVDLSKGLPKRQTKNINKADQAQRAKDGHNEMELDSQRREFVEELFKKE